MSAKSGHRSANVIIGEQLKKNASVLETAMRAHVITWMGPIQPPGDQMVRQAVEHRCKMGPSRRRLVVVLETGGGYIETAERIATTLRKHYPWIAFMVPNRAMSAGTVLAMAGDEIWMNYFSILGPIDPQVERPDGKRGLIPALGYLEKYNELVAKSAKNQLTPAEAAYFVKNFDAAEMFSYQQAKNLSIQLLKKWLVTYKFKNWKRTEKRNLVVTNKMRQERAEEIGKKLSDTSRWFSHGRGISMDVLQRDLNLHIEDIDAKPKVRDLGWTHWLRQPVNPQIAVG
jgi:membrane-bound ClpP family serine protease